MAKLSRKTAEPLSPEFRIIIYIQYLISLFLFPEPFYYAFLFSIVVPLLLFLPARVLKAGWIPIGVFLFFTFFGNIVNHTGRVVYSAGSFIITYEGLYFAAMRCTRLALMIGGVKILMSGLSSSEVVGALGRMLGPLERFGLPMKDFSEVLGLTLECFPLLQDKIASHYNEKIRHDREKGIVEKAGLVAAFLLPFFVESIRSPEIFFSDPESH